MNTSRTVIDHHIEAFNARTPDREPWSSGAELVSPGGTFTGRDAVLGFLSVFQNAFSEGRLRVDSAVIEGSMASVEGRFDGTHDGILQSPSGPVEATGKTVSFRWSATYLTDGDELVSEHLYFDQLDFLGQLGLLPE
ncbi:nuclear transport factor 2 family protein [Rhodococcus ruber]|uniref:Nuclear transport factor 2 family protein n=1 Tax=Rhodococcus ruber TaxID=1830 RepID=A0ABT4MKU1_9NOCA|nr:nuclear transport factor 2 family protein [Rhodococcus ruber]MCZ4521610.1 nuclear transport factor 2 family protein [Rhodococcus ruber]